MVCVFLKDLLHHDDSLLCGDSRQSNDAAVAVPFPEDQSSKIGVDCHENTCFVGRPFQKQCVPRIWSAFSSFEHVVSAGTQPVCKTAPRTAVDQELHLPLPSDAVEQVIRNRRPRILQTSADILDLKLRVIVEQSFGRLALCQEAEDQLNGNSHPANDRFAAKDGRIGSNSLQGIGGWHS